MFTLVSVLRNFKSDQLVLGLNTDDPGIQNPIVQPVFRQPSNSPIQTTSLQYGYKAMRDCVKSLTNELFYFMKVKKMFCSPFATQSFLDRKLSCWSGTRHLQEIQYDCFQSPYHFCVQMWPPEEFAAQSFRSQGLGCLACNFLDLPPCLSCR